MTMERTINTKDLRRMLPDIVKRLRRGERFTVLYRSQPAFRLVPIDALERLASVPLREDSLYGAPAIGRSDGTVPAADHDAVLYSRAR